MNIAFIISAIILLLAVFFVIAMSLVLYNIILVRTSELKWGRECSITEDAEYQRMYDIGLAWEQHHRDCKSEVFVQSDGFRLAGEYFDFGSDRAVIIVAGRTESCLYSYFFAEPYRVAGYNVLVIDNRAHGLSEGKRVSLGFKEYRDLLKWGELLHEEKGNAHLMLHGICIGSSVALFTLTDPSCPAYWDGMVAEGMYTTFAESFKNHMIQDHRPLFPIFYVTMLWVLLLSGANVMTDGPLKRLPLLKKPILFLHSREDVFSLPEKAELLYEKCKARKEMVWFETGAHSRLRIRHLEAYDAAVRAFAKRLRNENI